MLSKKYNGRIRFLKDTPALGEALSKAKSEGVLLTASSIWYRTDKPTACEAEFLLCDEKNIPWQVTAEFDGKKWNVDEKDVSSELGEMKDEAAFARAQKFLSEDDALELAKGQNVVKKAMRRAPHLLLVSSAFTIFDDEFNTATWRFTLKNWPLINYLKVTGEESRTVDIIIDAVKKKILGCKEYQ